MSEDKVLLSQKQLNDLIDALRIAESYVQTAFARAQQKDKLGRKLPADHPISVDLSRVLSALAQPSDGALTNEGGCNTCSNQGEVFVKKGAVTYGMSTEPDPVYASCPDCSAGKDANPVAKLEELYRLAIAQLECVIDTGELSRQQYEELEADICESVKSFWGRKSSPALTNEGAEPVAYADLKAFANFKSGVATHEWMWAFPDTGLAPLFLRPPAPASVVMSFDFEHPFTKQRLTVKLTKQDVYDGMEDYFYDKLGEKICQCESVGETNVVDCNCDEYVHDFELVADSACLDRVKELNDAK